MFYMNQSGLKEPGKPRQILLFLLCEDEHWIWAKIVLCILKKGNAYGRQGKASKGSKSYL